MSEERPLKATVLIPVFDHGDLVLRAAESVFAQTVEAFELFVVGDGASAESRAAAQELVARDARVRFFDNPKGARRGELLRHAALAEAKGSVVCYLTDDQLWLPDHLEHMLATLADCDFACALPTRAEPSGGLGVYFVELEDPRWLALRQAGICQIPFSAGGHTLEAYRRLPHGWRTTPGKFPTDLYMWLQFLEQPWCRARCTWRPTTINFPGWQRKGWAHEELAAELDRWLERIKQPGASARYLSEVMAQLMRERTARVARLPVGAWKLGTQLLRHPLVGEPTRALATELFGALPR